MSHVIVDEWLYPFMTLCSFDIISTEVVFWQHCLVVTWVVPHETVAVLVHILCTPYNHAPVYSVNLWKPHMSGACVLSCNLPPAPLAEWPGSSSYSCGNRGRTDTKIRVSTKSLSWRRKFSCCFSGDSNLWLIHFTSLVLYLLSYPHFPKCSAQKYIYIIYIYISVPVTISHSSKKHISSLSCATELFCHWHPTPYPPSHTHTPAPLHPTFFIFIFKERINLKHQPPVFISLGQSCNLNVIFPLDSPLHLPVIWSWWGPLLCWLPSSDMHFTTE